MNDPFTETKWTLDGDETSWTSWADQMVQAAASPLMQKIIANHRTSHRNWAVDVGCGTGRAFIPLVEAGYRVIGLEPTLKGVQLSQRRACQANLCAYPILASAARFPIPNASITFVFAFSSLFHLSFMELTSALREIHRVLLPDGIALLHFLDLADWRHTLAKEIYPDQAPIPSYQAVVTCFCSQKIIKEWILRAGLQLTKLELRTSSSEAGEQRNWLAHCKR
jgi:SAM-dependent methyltransferase